MFWRREIRVRAKETVYLDFKSFDFLQWVMQNLNTISKGFLNSLLLALGISSVDLSRENLTRVKKNSLE